MRRGLTTTALALAIAPPAAVAAPGDLDPSFSRDGKAIVASDRCGAAANAMAMQPDGRVLVAGTIARPQGRSCMPRHAAVARVNPDGRLDPSFDEDGIAEVERTTASTAIAVQPDGKILVGEGRQVFRLNLDGSLDTEFGAGGMLSGAAIDVRALAVQPDGRPLLGGATFGLSDCPSDCFAVARLMPNGAPDMTFGGGDGIATAFYPGVKESIRRLVVVADGSILAGGIFWSPGSGFMFARFTGSGETDTTFGDNGITPVQNPVPSFGAGGFDMVSQPEGRIVGVGQITAALGAVRIDHDGHLDPSFGGDGLARAGQFTPLEDVAWGNGAGLIAGGSILASGTTARIHRDFRDSYPAAEDFALARFTPSGDADQAFGGGDGQAVTDFYNGSDVASAGGLTDDGSYIVSGTVDDAINGTDIGIARFTNRPGRPDADADGKTDRRDRCPEAFATNRTGCPALKRRVELDYSYELDRFEGALTTRYRKCSAGRTTLLRKRRGPDERLFRFTDGNFVAKYGAPRGRFYARIEAVDLTIRGHCAATRSNVISLP